MTNKRWRTAFEYITDTFSSLQEPSRKKSHNTNENTTTNVSTKTTNDISKNKRSLSESEDENNYEMCNKLRKREYAVEDPSYEPSLSNHPTPMISNNNDTNNSNSATTTTDNNNNNNNNDNMQVDVAHDPAIVQRKDTYSADLFRSGHSIHNSGIYDIFICIYVWVVIYSIHSK